MAGDTEAASDQTDWRELVAVLLLSVTAILTAWSGFQASKWSGAMSIAFSEASGARIQAARLDGVADRKLTVQASLFTQWLETYQVGDKELMEFMEARFPEPLNSAFQAWLTARPLRNPDAPATPFDTDEYVIPEAEEAQAEDARADERFDSALQNNQRGDDYTVLTVAFAAVLFFAAMSGRVRSARAQWMLLGIGIAGLVVASGFLLTFPRLV